MVVGKYSLQEGVTLEYTPRRLAVINRDDKQRSN